MDKEVLIDSIVKKIRQLPDSRLREVENFADFLLQKIDDTILQEGIQKMTSNSKTFEYLLDEETIYTVNDLKERYK